MHFFFSEIYKRGLCRAGSVVLSKHASHYSQWSGFLYYNLTTPMKRAPHISQLRQLFRSSHFFFNSQEFTYINLHKFRLSPGNRHQYSVNTINDKVLSVCIYCNNTFTVYFISDITLNLSIVWLTNTLLSMHFVIFPSGFGRVVNFSFNGRSCHWIYNI
jgi:hypothetical protein